MTRLLTHPSAVLVFMAGIVCPLAASAQLQPAASSRTLVANVASVLPAELRGLVLDERGRPLAGVIISALGSASVFAVSDRGGRFTLRDLPPGPYLVRAHLQGYIPVRARIVQVTSTSRDISIALTRVQGAGDQPQILEAGIGGVDPATASAIETDSDDQGEIAWRLRHLKRSVLKDMDTSGIVTAALAGTGNSFMGDSLSALGRAMGTPVRFASDFFADLPLNGQINLLTSTSFDRPQDLFSTVGGMPSSQAFVSLTAPTATGKWNVRGGTMQGDLTTWIVAGSYVWRPAGASHQYRSGMSYGMQRYLGGNADALTMTDGRRNAGEIYAFDDWAITSRVDVSYGTRYARYDYLARETLLSPKASVTVTPLPHASLRLRGTVSRRELAPGAEEFAPPSTGMWMPQGGTFVPASTQFGFSPERIDHVEIAAEQPLGAGVVVGVRAFHQQVSDQTVTFFGISPSRASDSGVGHYYVGNAGDVDVHGWGASLSRTVAAGLRASIDYTQSDADWLHAPVGAGRGSIVTRSAVRRQDEQLRDLTTSLESDVPGLDTHVFVIYKINSGFAGSDPRTPGPHAGTRFDVQITQALPFLNFTSAQWEMIVAVRNLFREELLDASVYDELEVVRPPKHVVCGVTVHF